MDFVYQSEIELNEIEERLQVGSAASDASEKVGADRHGRTSDASRKQFLHSLMG